MDTTKLFAALDQAIAKSRPIEEKIFLRLLKEVWQVDSTVAPSNVWYHMIGWDVPYFLRFMAFDEGDEAEEERLISDWMRFRREIIMNTTGSELRKNIRIRDLTNEANRIRDNAR